MRPTIPARRALLPLALIALAAQLGAASIQAAKPEDVGLSSERLQRVHEAMLRHIDAHDVSGAVTLVARKGRIAYFEADGLIFSPARAGPTARSQASRLWAALSK
jgi:hypothetical protein